MATTPPRACTRYDDAGKRCLNVTVRVDGWCGRCAGFPTSDPAADRRTTGWGWGPAEDWHAERLGLEPDEAYEVGIIPGVVDRYCAAHQVTRPVAEAQIRSLLEDLITCGAPSERNPKGFWRIYLQREGYGLGLTADRSAVARYRTRHAERTWSQFKGGVPSRVRASRGARTPAWMLVAMQEADLPVGVSTSALHQYARRSLGLRANQDNIREILDHLGCHLRTHVVPRWQGETEDAVDDGCGGTWILARSEDAPDGTVISARFNASGPEITV